MITRMEENLEKIFLEYPIKENESPKEYQKRLKAILREQKENPRIVIK